MRNTALLCIFALLVASVWWFRGREPYITMEHPSDPILIYHSPTWSGWDRRGLKWISDLPQQIRADHPDASGWWHIVHLMIPEKDLPPIDMGNPEKTMSEWEQYYKWVPLGYELPHDRIQ